jgi:hypothetical protein
MTLLTEFQRTYQFAIVKCHARPFMKKAAEIQEEIMAKGIQAEQVPKETIRQN